MNAHHHIRRQRWRLGASNAEAAFAMRSLLRQELDTLNQVFERALDVACPDQEVIHLPRLELNLRIAGHDALFEQLSLALAEQLASLSTRTSKGTPQRLPQAVQRRHSLLQFLRTGTLEWYALATDAPSSARLLAEELETWLNEGPRGRQTLLASAPEALDDAIAFFLRLFNLLPDQDRRDLMQETWEALLAGGSPQEASHGTLVQALASLSNPGRNAYPRRYLYALKLAVLTIRQQVSGEQIAMQLQDALGTETARQFLTQISGQGQRPITSPLIANTADGDPLAQQPGPLLAPRPQVSDVEVMTPTQMFPSAAPHVGVPLVPSDVYASLHSADQAETPGLRVHAAGLVLLHPYLPRLFTASRIECDEIGRIVGTSLPRAAALLHRLATGREEIHEFELGLIKLLLGLPVEAPLAVAPGLLDPSDAEECNALLAAAITHWSALKSTSSDGLRISFLQRHGLLHDSGGHWQLHIESEAFDVLLAQLPWSISLIKLPWMTKPIFTDWPTR
jgi:hypothetical protein